MSTHQLELHPGVDTAAFEQFVTQDALPVLQLPGTTLSLLKGDRGERQGAYLLLWEFDSIERRDHYFPTSDTVSEDARQALQLAPAVLERWASFGVPPGQAVYTDYVVVEETTPQ